MERLTISMPDAFAEELSAFMAEHHYDNRSEALRDLARLGLERARMDTAINGQCLATLTYCFNHHTRELASRLTENQHAHHDLQVASMHVHLDHENCFEIAVLRGAASQVRDFANGVIAERGVIHGQMNFVPVSLETSTHSHDDGTHAHRHTHVHPKS